MFPPRFVRQHKPPRGLKGFLFYTAVLKNRAVNRKDELSLIPKTVSHKYRLIYVPNPLVASNTIRQILRNLDRNIETVYGTDLGYDNYLKFSFVRNPITRVKSCYTKKILNADSVAKLHMLSKYKGLHYDMSLKEFIDWLLTEEGSDKYADRHWVSQHKLVADCDFIGKLENFEEDLNRLLGFTPEIPKLASSGYLSKECQEEITDDMMNKILRRYGKDFVKFNYEVAK